MIVDRSRVLIVVATATFHAACATSGDPPGERGIRAELIRAHLEFLADDLLEGREAGSRGYDLAAAYVASQFKQLGLEPAGSGGSYFQVVPLRRATIVANSLTLEVERDGARIRFTAEDHLAARPSTMEEEQQIEAPLLFAGYGTDYAGLDARGKLVVVLGGPPPGLPSEVAAHLGSFDEQRATAAKHGAIGVLIVYMPALETRWAFKNLAELYRQSTFDWFDPAVPRHAQSKLRVSAVIDQTAATALFEGAARTFAEIMEEARTKIPRGFDLRGRAVFTRRSQHAAAKSGNVLGFLPGADPELSKEVLVFTSHLDHVGIGEPKNGDAIYNGALDNAAGIAVMLEVARGLIAERSRLRRSVLFFATTAEEKGLIGADYFARNPTIDRERLVGVINLDGAMPFFELVDVIGYGADSSTLGDSLRRAAASLGISVSPDTAPEQGYFTRSDHYPFVRQGVPGIFLIAGDAPTPDGKNAAEISREWSAKHLHQPSDDLDQPFEDGHLIKWGELFLRWTFEASIAAERPLWYADDYFGGHYAPKANNAPRRR